MEKKFNTDMGKKQDELEKLQESIKEKIDKKLAALMESFNQEKAKYEELGKQEIEINNSFGDLKKKYDNFKLQIDKKREKEEKHMKETLNLENRIK